MRPGGRLLLSVPGAARLHGAADELAGHLRRYERGGLVAKLERAGFADVRLVAYSFPVGYRLKKLRDLRGSRAERTAASGRWLEPGESLAPVTWAAALPVRYLQRPFGRLGPGLVAAARRPA